MAPETTTPASTGRRRISTSPQAVDLLHQAQAGSSEAFADLYRLYRDLVTRYVWVRVHHRDAVDDLVHDTFTDPHRVNLLAALIAAAPLTDDQRQALRLRLDGYPREVAAAQLDRSRNAVKCLEWHAVRRLRSIAGGAL